MILRMWLNCSVLVDPSHRALDQTVDQEAEIMSVKLRTIDRWTNTENESKINSARRRHGNNGGNNGQKKDIT